LENGGCKTIPCGNPAALPSLVRFPGAESGDRLIALGAPAMRALLDLVGSSEPYDERSLALGTLARMVDACAANEIYPFYGPFGDFSDPVGCEDQFRAAFILGCVGAWTLHPNQIPIAKRVFRPNPDEVRFARRVVAAMEAAGGGGGVAVVDGKMQDDATFKQCQVLLELAEMLSAKDAELAQLYAD